MNLASPQARDARKQLVHAEACVERDARALRDLVQAQTANRRRYEQSLTTSQADYLVALAAYAEAIK